jgi:hypothetical protein
MLAARKAGTFASPVKGAAVDVLASLWMLTYARKRPPPSGTVKESMLRRGFKEALIRSSGAARPSIKSPAMTMAFGITLDVEAAPPTADGIAVIGPHDETSAINPFAVSILMNANSRQPV